MARYLRGDELRRARNALMLVRRRRLDVDECPTCHADRGRSVLAAHYFSEANRALLRDFWF